MYYVSSHPVSCVFFFCMIFIHIMQYILYFISSKLKFPCVSDDQIHDTNILYNVCLIVSVVCGVCIKFICCSIARDMVQKQSILILYCILLYFCLYHCHRRLLFYFTIQLTIILQFLCHYQAQQQHICEIC